MVDWLNVVNNSGGDGFDWVQSFMNSPLMQFVALLLALYIVWNIFDLGNAFGG